MSKLALIAFCALAVGSAAFARDGRIEINQASATAGGVNGDLAADPPGFPVRITQPGSYRLTGDLLPPSIALGGILIAAGTDDVTIDLGGFAIRGSSGVVVEPPSWSCATAFGAGIGIRAEPGGAATSKNVVVRNGRVLGFANTGVDLSGDGSRVEDVHAESNCGIGIALGDDAQIESSAANRNLALGMLCGVACRIVGGVVAENGGGGLRPLGDSIVSGSTVRDNGGDDIRGFESTLVVDVTVSDDALANLRLERGSLVLGGSITGLSAVLEAPSAAWGLTVLRGSGSTDVVGALSIACVVFETSGPCP